MFDHKIFLLTIFFIALCPSSFCQEVKTKIPNYDFSLDSLKAFFPGSNLEDIEKEVGKGEVMKKGENFLIKKYYIAQIRYKFPVFVQYNERKSLDFFARLPTYFLHDLFHQSLINRYGPQNKYINLDSSSLYVWNNAKGFKIIYNGACTITCFPQFLFVSRPEDPKIDSYRSLIDQFREPFPLSYKPSQNKEP